MLLNEKWVHEKIKKDIENVLEKNYNEIVTHQNLCNDIS